ncbi:E3 ubiquitin-protein ligase rififylin-like [Etheostoma cragini]|uniref:E3 ubiquitin-protein ligase rififylin-like n=1 Tax=Etheostoma cragini TaxID=417921 RepID=UPI00155DE5D6|nr:E3 ubiquitin-protein ligase rififylin-like [Etheostoma cragini]
MFLSCCNWLCMDSGDGVDRSAAERRHQSYTNSGFNRQPSPSEPSCKACGGRLNTPATKHVCVDCKKDYCSRCSAQLEPRPRLCHTCQRFYGNLLERAELMKLKVKELRDYLHLHEVSTHLCREKVVTLQSHTHTHSVKGCGSRTFRTLEAQSWDGGL